MARIYQPSRRSLLVGGAALAAAAALGRAPRARAAAKPTKLITVFVGGGWDVTMSTAPRLDDPYVDGPRVDEDPTNPDDVEYLRTFGDIEVACNDVKRPSAATFFERWSSYATVVHGCFTGAVGHETSTVRMMTGTPSNTSADLGAIVGKVFGDDTPLGYVALAGTPFVGPFAASSGRVGFNSQLKMLFDPSAAFRPAPGVPGSFPLSGLDDADRASVQVYAAARAEALREARGYDALVSQRLADLDESIDRAARFEAAAGDLIDSLTLGQQPSFERQGTLAADLLQRDVCKAVLLDSNGGWDTHTSNVTQHGNYESLFAGLDHLMSALELRDQLQHTLVMVVSEMTRAPKLNKTLGKDHWPHASVLLLGAGVRGQASLGGYDPLMESLPQDFATGALSDGGEMLRHDHLIAGLLEHLDIDPAEFLPEATPYRAFVA